MPDAVAHLVACTYQVKLFQITRQNALGGRLSGSRLPTLKVKYSESRFPFTSGSAIRTSWMSCCGLGGTSSPTRSGITSTPGRVHGSPLTGGGGGGGGTQLATAAGQTPVRSVTVIPASADFPASWRLMKVAWPAASSVQVMNEAP